MKISKLRIVNYKGFREIDNISFGPGVNIIVGKNNSGKTALLETLRMHLCQSKPYLGPSVLVANPISEFDATFLLSSTELREGILKAGGDYAIPIHPDYGDSFIADFWKKDKIDITARFTYEKVETISYPSHGMFPHSASNMRNMTFSANRDKTDIVKNGVGAGSADSLPQLLKFLVANKIFVFKAERLNLGMCGISNDDVLKSDASNLPEVLLKLFSQPYRRDKFNMHVREIFPNIKEVVVTSSINGNLSVEIWNVDPSINRDDLKIKLSECGTGVGQVLAILSVAMSRSDNVIVIDEPNSFLHPGASRVLIDILKRYNNNQYIISTHAPEIISISVPDTIHQICWIENESVALEYKRDDISDMEKILSDIGAKLSDVFGADKVVWVEGETERKCFPKILKLSKLSFPGISFVSLRSTGDLEKKNHDPAIMDIYDNLTKGACIVPPALCFALDTEDRTQQQIADIRRRTRNRAHFLDRLTYENYLISSPALSAVICQLLSGSGSDKLVTAEDITAWITENASNYAPSGIWRGNVGDDAWLKACHAPKLLNDLFQHFLGSIYRKIPYSEKLTDWLIENKPESLQGLLEYIEKICSDPEVA